MSMSMLLAVTTFASRSGGGSVTHIGPTVLTLLCATGFLLPVFVGLGYIKGLWYLRRELQPARYAFGLLFKAGLCACVSFGSVFIYNVFVAPSLGRF